MNSDLKLKLIKLHLRSIMGKYVRNDKVTLPDGSAQDVTVFSGQKSLFLGQYTPLGTIAINECLLINKEVLNYVLIHEIAHSKQWWKILFAPWRLSQSSMPRIILLYHSHLPGTHW